MEWQRVAALDEVPEGGTFPATFRGEPVCVYNVGGRILATHDVCTHEDASLADGFIVDGKIECPLHQGRFDVRDGRALCSPLRENVATYPVRIEDGIVFVGM